MKKLFTILSATIVAFAANAQNPIMDTVTYGAGYQNQIYYSMPNDEVGNASIQGWDIGFTTDLMDAAIIANPAKGVVYKVQNTDSTGFAALDTTGMASGWLKVWNSETTWHTGAFNQGASSQTEFGWGVYEGVSHNVYGDSLFVLKNTAGTMYKKLWIKRKTPTNHVIFEIANLDNTADTTIDINCNHATKNFVYYNISSNMQLDIEPATSTWDVLFCRYETFIPQPYLVAGVLSNKHTKTAEADMQDFTNVVYANYASNLDTTINIIGYDWKTFTGVWTVHDSTIYFVVAKDGSIWKMHFLEFGGGATGQVVLEKQLIQGVNVNEIEGNKLPSFVYPNPSSDKINVYCSMKNEGEITASLFDLNGKEICTNKFSGSAGLKSYPINVSNLADGIYFLHLNSAGNSNNLKVIISK